MSSPPPSLAKYPLLDVASPETATASSDSLPSTAGFLQQLIFEPAAPHVIPADLSTHEVSDLLDDLKLFVISPSASLDVATTFASNIDGTHGLGLEEIERIPKLEDDDVYNNALARRVALLGYEDETHVQQMQTQDGVQQLRYLLPLEASAMVAAESLLQSASPHPEYHPLPSPTAIVPLASRQSDSQDISAQISTQVNWQWPTPEQVILEWPQSAAQGSDAPVDAPYYPWGAEDDMIQLRPQIKGLLGEGGFGRVMLAQLPEHGGEYVALKIHHKAKLFRNKHAREELLQELSVMQDISGGRLAFACHLLQSWEDHSDIYFMMVRHFPYFRNFPSLLNHFPSFSAAHVSVRSV